MSKRLVTSVLLVVFFVTIGITPGFGQNYGGYWLGVTYPSDPNNAIYNYFGNFTQKGNEIGGTGQTADPNLPFGGVAQLKGAATPGTVKFKESDAQGSINTTDVCYWDFSLTYDPTEESLKGTYKNIYNPGYCELEGGGKVELYRIVLKSGTKYCKNQPVNLTVTGKNIRWYESASKGRIIAQGNNFSPKINQTTTYYIAQTLYNTESPAIPIKVEIVDVAIVDAKVQNSTCGPNKGQLTVLATGSDALQYSLDGARYQVGNVFSELSGGEYTVSVKDPVGCVATSKATLIQTNGSKIATATALPTTCGQENGSINVTTAAANVQFSIDGSKFQPGADFRNLAAGSYIVTMKEAAGCTDTKAVVVAASERLEITGVDTKPASCGKKDGSLTLTASGGAGFQYSADGGATFQASPQFTGLADNIYEVQVRNAAGCVTELEAELKGAAAPTISSVKTQNPTCGETNGQLTVAATGTGMLQYSLDGTNFQGGNVFEKLTGGDFTVTIKDDKGCAATKKATLAKSSAVKIGTAQATATTCGEANGSIVLTTDELDVRYSLDGVTYQREAAFENMMAANYTVTMQGPLGCTDTRAVTVAGSEGPALSNVLLSPVSCGVADGTISVQATARTAMQYALDGGNYSSQSSFANLAVGDYEIAVRDAENCVVSRKVTVRSDCANTIFVPTSFSPNGDGQNDQLTVHFPFPSLQFSSVRIFNRWGNAVHGSQNLTLSNGDAIWDGKLDGQTPLTENYYVVVAEVMFDDGSSHTFRKEVMIMR